MNSDARFHHVALNGLERVNGTRVRTNPGERRTAGGTITTAAAASENAARAGLTGRDVTNDATPPPTMMNIAVIISTAASSAGRGIHILTFVEESIVVNLK